MNEQLVNNEAQSRYELNVDGKLAAQVQYRLQDGAVAFTHTEVDPAWEGQGLGSRLAKFALDDVKTRGLQAQPQCAFIAGYIQRHDEEFGELVAR